MQCRRGVKTLKKNLIVLLDKHNSKCIYVNLFAGEECIPNQFHGFLRVDGSFKKPRFSSGRTSLSEHLLHCLVLFSLTAFGVSIHYLFLPASAAVERLNVWQVLVALFATYMCLFSRISCWVNVHSSRRSFVVCHYNAETGCYCLLTVVHSSKRLQWTRWRADGVHFCLGVLNK